MVESSIGSLGNNDSDGCKNVQVQLRSFKLYRAYSISFSSLNVGNFFVNWILKDCIEDQEKKKRKSLPYVQVVVVLWRQRNAQESVMHVQSCCFANLNLLLVLPFLLTSPLSLLKLPHSNYETNLWCSLRKDKVVWMHSQMCGWILLKWMDIYEEELKTIIISKAVKIL